MGMKNIGILTSGIAVIVMTGLARAFVGIKLYCWFLLPVGLPNLSIGQLYGLMFFVRFIAESSKKKEEVKDKELSLTTFLVDAVLTSIVSSALWLSVGWIIKSILY